MTPHILFSRTSLTKQAEKESVDLFMTNLYRLLLTPPVRGKSVLGLDPGFSHGCKLAVLSSTGRCNERPFATCFACHGGFISGRLYRPSYDDYLIFSLKNFIYVTGILLCQTALKLTQFPCLLLDFVPWRTTF